MHPLTCPSLCSKFSHTKLTSPWGVSAVPAVLSKESVYLASRMVCLCRSAFLLCIGFNIVLQFTASAIGEEKIELIVDTLLKGALAAVPFAGSLN